MSAGLSYFCNTVGRVYAFCLFSPTFFSRATASEGFQRPARKQQQPPTHLRIDQECWSSGPRQWPLGEPLPGPLPKGHF